MIVIGLIGVLVTLGIVIGRGQISQAKVRQTVQMMEVLDQLLTEYQSEYGSLPIFDEREFYGARNVDYGGRMRPEVAVFLAQVKGLNDSLLGTLPPEFLMSRVNYFGLSDGRGGWRGDYPNNEPEGRITLTDAWGLEIVYIHPDAEDPNDDRDPVDLFGTPINDRPYFVSAGPDNEFYTRGLEEDPANDPARKDNIYSDRAVERPEEEQ